MKVAVEVALEVALKVPTKLPHYQIRLQARHEVDYAESAAPLPPLSSIP